MDRVAREESRVRFFGDDDFAQHGKNLTIEDLEQLPFHELNPADRSTLLVENASDELVRRLHIKEIMPRLLWDKHITDIGSSEPRLPLWNAVFRYRESFAEEDHRSCSIRGIFEYGKGTGLVSFKPNSIHCARREESTTEYGVNSSTRISYGTLLNDDHLVLYIILIDAPRQLRDSSSGQRTVLRVPHADSRGGLMLPPLFRSADHSLFESFVEFLSHGWHRHMLFESGPLIDSKVLTYLLCISLWTANLRSLRLDIESVSFAVLRNEIQEASSTNRRLHGYRRDLAFLRESVAYANTYIPKKVKRDTHRLGAQLRHESLTNPNMLTALLHEAKNLQNFLDDSFKLWMANIAMDQADQSNNLLAATNSIADKTKDAAEAIKDLIAVTNDLVKANQMIAAESARKADESAYQTTRATALTLLAAIYLPLSFATGIFGMNISAVDPANQWSVGHFLATLFTLLALTLGIMGIYLYWEKRSRRKNEKARLITAQDLGGYELSIPPKMWET